MEILIKVAQFLLSLSLLIVLHEFGHFIAARIFNTRVEKFFLFFDAWGKKLFSFKKGDTEYGIGWLPLGGYVKIAGMIDESMDKEQMKLPPKDDEFRSKPAWQRLIIMLGGVTVNFILGILIYIMIVFVWGEVQVKPQDVKYGFSVHDTFKQYGFKDGDIITEIDGVEPLDITSEINRQLFLRDLKTLSVQHADGKKEIIKLPKKVGSIMWENGIMQPFNVRHLARIDSIVPETAADKAGFKKGDKVISVNNKPVTFWNEFTKHIDSIEVNVGVLRNKDTIQLKVTPKYIKEAKAYQIGVTTFSMKDALEEKPITYSFAQSISRGNQLAISTLKNFIFQFRYVFTKKGASEVGGFIAIGKIFPATWNWAAFWSITALLSIMLGFMNLLPIPALDGGHALFVLVEMLTGRKPSDKFLEYAQIVGFVLLMGLLLLANGNDIYKLIKGWL
jgi:regulator of sigma E protease